MKTKSIWKPNTVFSVKLKNGYFCLVQTFATQTKLAVFNHFRSNEDWHEIKLSHDSVLFCCVIFKNFFQYSHISRRPDIQPCPGIPFPDRMISIGEKARKITLWQNTENQRELVVLGGSPNSICTSTLKEGKLHLDYAEIQRSDYSQYNTLEVTTLRAYPEFNERLCLCAKLGKNYDPLRELAFDQPLGLECLDYVDIISGRTRVSDLGY